MRFLRPPIELVRSMNAKYNAMYPANARSAPVARSDITMLRPTERSRLSGMVRAIRSSCGSSPWSSRRSCAVISPSSESTCLGSRSAIAVPAKKISAASTSGAAWLILPRP